MVVRVVVERPRCPYQHNTQTSAIALSSCRQRPQEKAVGLRIPHANTRARTLVVISDVILGHGLLPRVQDPEDVVLDARGADVEAVGVDGGGVGQVEGVLHELQAVLGAQLVHL